ncbi:MAG: GNAT family N-acetyltransferase [Caldiserica bacterium]|nr:GNAT family N-acetyltransferase [Caldisericota bacterium]
MNSPGLTFKPATRDDTPFVARLMYDIGRRDLDRLLTGIAAGLSPFGIVEKFYQAPGGMFSWRNTEVALHDNLPAGFITAYRATSRNGSDMWLARAVGRLGAKALMLLAWRGAIVARAMQHHLSGSWYVAFVGVDPLQQSVGIGSSLIERSIQTARASGCSCVELDVDVDNPRAQALYERLGFHIVHADRRWKSSSMVETRRMILPLQA